MIMNFILLKNNYPPVVIKTRARNNYLKALRKADKSNLPNTEKENYDGLVAFISEQMTSSYWNIFL